ncbi:MAG TPA: sulfatase, partial [Thermoanaerobaculia bacterium]|nr:sulfatase [Thermoanaerobaculia bacterium]
RRVAASLCAAFLPALLAAVLACGGEETTAVLGAGVTPLHLEDHVAAARVTAEVAASARRPLRWSFAEPDPGWFLVGGPEGQSSRMSWEGSALVLSVDRRPPRAEGYRGSVGVALPDLEHAEWGEIVIRARSRGVDWLNPAFNLGERYVEEWDETTPVRYIGEGTAIVGDGREHVYRLQADAILPAFPAWEEGESWRELVLAAWARSPGRLEILSVEVVPRLAGFAEAAAGVRAERRKSATRRTLYSHVPGEVAYRVEVPPAARLDVGLAVLQRTKPVTFRVVAEEAGGEAVLFSEAIDATGWQQRSVDLSPLAGRTVTLTLAADGDPGAIAFWAAPTLSGSSSAEQRRAHPNVVFYVIDGAGADLMSLYGYNRRTTPNLERIAAEGVVFERAHSNAAWTKPSTASFMTSLHQSVLGGFQSLQEAIPPGVTTMAEHFHRAGYQTAVLTTNPWAGSMSGLERGVDWFRDHEEGGEHSTSSVRLHREFWDWREQYPGRPFWVHFQTTDVHEPHRPTAPFAGLFVSPERRRWFDETWEKLTEGEGGNGLGDRSKDPRNSLADLYRERLASLGVDARQFFDTQRGLYDETMAHQDHQLGRLVERLKASGEWQHTLLVVASDHGHPAGSFSRFGRELFEPVPASDEGALLDSYRTRVPLVVVWPGRLPAGRRVAAAVSMIDTLPTLLELAGLPPPEVLQGRSLVPLLRGDPGWEPQPLILEQLQPLPDHGTFVGHIEMIDGRWGASLEIWPEGLDPAVVRPIGNQRAARPHRPGMPRLYLYDLWEDPFARRRVNDEHPELVERYTRLLVKQWKAHQALAKRFEPGAEVELTPEQIESLRALGYI